MRRLPTILAQRRVMDADFCGGRRPFVSEAEHREGAAVQYFGTDTEDVARRDVGIEAADELLGQRRRVGFQLAARDARPLGDEVGGQPLAADCHSRLPVFGTSASGLPAGPPSSRSGRRTEERWIWKEVVDTV